MRVLVLLLVMSAVLPASAVVLDQEAYDIIFKLVDEFVKNPTDPRFSSVIKMSGSEALKVSKLFIWCPVRHFGLPPLKCPLHGCELKYGKWSKLLGTGKKQPSPRMIFDFGGNIILIQCHYECYTKHSFPSASSEILQLLPEYVQNMFPIKMHYLTAFSKQLYNFIISGAQQHQSFKKMSEAIASLNLRQYLHHCSTTPTNASQAELIEQFGCNQMFSFPNNAKLMHVFLNYYSEVNKILHLDMGAKMGKVLTCDGTFKFINKRVGVMRPREGANVLAYEGVFIATNEQNEVVFWRLTNSGSSTEIEEMLGDYRERLALQGEVLSMAVVDHCCEVRSLYESIFGPDICIKLNVQQATDSVFATFTKGGHKSEMVADFSMVFRAEGDHGLERLLPTPDIAQMESNLNGFLARWVDKLSEATRAAITVVRGHILQGCLSGIPPRCGTEYNDELQEHISKGFMSNVTTLSPELAIAVLAFTLFSWNTRRKYWNKLTGALQSHMDTIIPPELLGMFAEGTKAMDLSRVDRRKIVVDDKARGVQVADVSELQNDSSIMLMILRILHLREFNEIMQDMCIVHGFNILESLYLDKMFFLLRMEGDTEVDEAGKNMMTLEQNLSSYGLKIEKIIGDGNCCFRSIVTQMIKITKKEENVKYADFVKSLGLSLSVEKDTQFLRDLFVEEMSTNLPKYQKWIGLKEEKLRKEAEKFKEDGFYNGELGDFCVKVCSEILRIPIVVVTSFENAPHVPFMPEEVKICEPIILAFDHTAPGHYDATEGEIYTETGDKLMCNCGKNGASGKVCKSVKCTCKKQGMFCNPSCRCRDCSNKATPEAALQGRQNRPADLICKCGASDSKDSKIERCKDKENHRRSKCPCVRKGFGCSWKCKCHNCANILNTADTNASKTEPEEGVPAKRRRINPISYKRAHGMESTWTPGYDTESCNWSMLEKIAITVIQDILSSSGLEDTPENVMAMYRHLSTAALVNEMKLPITGKRFAQVSAKLKEQKAKQNIPFPETFFI